MVMALEEKRKRMVVEVKKRMVILLYPSHGIRAGGTQRWLDGSLNEWIYGWMDRLEMEQDSPFAGRGGPVSTVLTTLDGPGNRTGPVVEKISDRLKPALQH